MCKISNFTWRFFIYQIMFCNAALANIEFDEGTRFIFSARHSQKSITVANTGKETALVAATLNLGDADQEFRDFPMALSKPLFKIPAGEKQTIDIFYQGAGLPQDRESYFLLSVTDIPPTPKQKNMLQIALRHRLKLFFRPLLSMRVEDAFAKLHWTQPSRSEYRSIKAHNESPYYLTLTNIRFYGVQGQICGNNVEHLMVAPFSTLNVSTAGCLEPVNKITGMLINDEGHGISQTMNVTTP